MDDNQKEKTAEIIKENIKNLLSLQKAMVISFENTIDNIAANPILFEKLSQIEGEKFAKQFLPIFLLGIRDFIFELNKNKVNLSDIVKFIPPKEEIEKILGDIVLNLKK